MSNNIRVRFAPSPTGALHIGGVRTALYNYLLAKKLGGTFILRIEDTDQKRYVAGAEKYIIDALDWCGITPMEGPGFGGEFGPYRQSERKEHYAAAIQVLIDKDWAYYAFDTPEELDEMREKLKAEGNHTFKYDNKLRSKMKNSTTMSPEEVKAKLEANVPHTVRFKIPTGELVKVNDIIRGEVTFSSDELDDKVLMKADGLPTYHLANIVDDHMMKISHVIRGEEWLPSTALHVLLYRAFGWEDTMPVFAHLPLILKPNGKGKLSKRDGKSLGIPVFPLSWKGDTPEDSFEGFKEYGFDPNAVLNFLAFLGWNPGTEQEIFSLEELCQAFSIERIGKSGARFDFDKAKWYNQQYLIASDSQSLVNSIRPEVKTKGYDVTDEFLLTFVDLMKERVEFTPDFLNKGYYFFEPVKHFDDKMIKKKWKEGKKEKMYELPALFNEIDTFTTEQVEKQVKMFMERESLGFGDILPILRIAMTGTMKGPSVFDMIALLGKQEVNKRLTVAFDYFEDLKSNAV